MVEIAVLLRFKQLISHNMHNMVMGVTFFADHAFLGDFYSQAEGQYDSVIERMIGLGISFDINEIQKEAVALLTKKNMDLSSPNDDIQFLIGIEKTLIKEIEKVCKASTTTQGTVQLLGDIANQSEMNLYKMHQRVC